MLPAHTTVAEVNRSWPAGAGDEHYLVIMFVDMRGSTRLTVLKTFVSWRRSF
jgi:hypothetical protein